jgi:type II secretory pathway pseudopilin PulG
MAGQDARRLRELLFEAEGREMPARPRTTRRAAAFDLGSPMRPGHAFSLIELIGVLAVLAILAVVLVSVVVRCMDRAALRSETASLSSLSDALVQHVLRSNNIPDQTTWSRAVGTELALAEANITNTARGYARAFLIDESGWLGTALASGPWSQTPGGTTTAPAGARIMIVSTIAKALPISSGTPKASDFNDIWSAPAGSKPNNSTWNSWAGRGDDLVIQRMNLSPLFHRVVLVNGYIGGQGYFSINGGQPAPVPLGGSGTNTYYLDGTVLGLHNTNQTLTVKEIIRSDMSRVFEYGLWRDQLDMGLTNGPPLGLASIASAFYTNSPPGGWGGNLNTWGGTPQTVLGLMTAYMNGYTTWASMVPCFSYSGSGTPNAANFPAYNEIHDAINAFAKGGAVVP